MKTTISLGKELSYFTNNITNVFTTKDYTGELIRQYEEHVGAFYDEEVVNEFDQLYRFKKVLAAKYFGQDPCETPLADIDDVQDELKYIIENRSAFKATFKIMMDHARDGYAAGNLIYDLIYMLKNDSKGFKECAMRYDRYMGDIFPVSDVIRSIVAYGRLSGLVDFYNFQETKDGKEAPQA
ncbi:hypothetical protein VPHD69_0208 [Vibrio phage D69]